MKFFSSMKVCCEVPESQMWVLASFSSAFLTWGASADVDVDVKLACVRKVPTSESAGTSRSASQCFSSDFAARAAIGGSSLRLPRLTSWPAGCNGLLSGLGRFGRSLGCGIQHSFSLWPGFLQCPHSVLGILLVAASSLGGRLLPVPLFQVLLEVLGFADCGVPGDPRGLDGSRLVLLRKRIVGLVSERREVVSEARYHVLVKR
jgi:hypothetical protein